MTRRHRHVSIAFGFVLLAGSACGSPPAEEGGLEPTGPAQDSSAEQPPGDAPENVEGQTGAADTGSQCADVLEGSGDTADVEAARQDYTDMDLVTALESISDVRHVASSFQTPEVSGELDGIEQMTLFAPVSEAFHERSRAESGAEDIDESADDNSYTQWPADTVLFAHLVTGDAHSIGELVDLGSVELVDGSTLEITAEGGVATVTRGGLVADVLCGDIEVSNGFIHIVDTVLFESDETDVEDDELGSNQEEPFRGSDAPGAADPPEER